MLANDRYLHPLSILFDPDLTVINNVESRQIESYIKIRITPTNDHKDIESINIVYYDPLQEPPRFEYEINQRNIFDSITNSIKNSSHNLVDSLSSYMTTLSSEEIAIISNEYSKYITEGAILDGLISGIAAYLAYLLLIENNILTRQLPFQISIPQSNTLNHNMFQYISMSLLPLAKVSKGLIQQLVLFVQSFINIWDPLFIDGPEISSYLYSYTNISITTGLSQYVHDLLIENRNLHISTKEQADRIEGKIQNYLDEQLSKNYREVNNLIAETRYSVSEIILNSEQSVPDKDFTKKIHTLEDRILKLEERIEKLQNKNKLNSLQNIKEITNNDRQRNNYTNVSISEPGNGTSPNTDLDQLSKDVEVKCEHNIQPRVINLSGNNQQQSNKQGSNSMRAWIRQNRQQYKRP